MSIHLRYRVITTLIKRVTAAEAFYSQPYSFAEAVSADGLTSVFRARWSETAA